MDKTMQQESETKPNLEIKNIRTSANTTDRVQNCYSEIPELSEPRYLEYTLAATIHLVDRLNGMIEDEKHRFRFIENKIVRKQLQFNEIQSSIDYEKQDLAFSIKTRPNSVSSHRVQENRINRLIKRQEILNLDYVKEQALQGLVYSFLEYVQLKASHQAVLNSKAEIIAKLDQIKKDRENNI
jgi:hypothetical protein